MTTNIEILQALEIQRDELQTKIERCERAMEDGRSVILYFHNSIPVQEAHRFYVLDLHFVTSAISHLNAMNFASKQL